MTCKIVVNSIKFEIVVNNVIELTTTLTLNWINSQTRDKNKENKLKKTHFFFCQKQKQKTRELRTISFTK